VRISAGIEDIEDLKEDLTQALESSSVRLAPDQLKVTKITKPQGRSS